MSQFKYRCKHIPDYDTQPLPVIRKVPHPFLSYLPEEERQIQSGTIIQYDSPHASQIKLKGPWIIDLPFEDTYPQRFLSQFETIHAHSIISREEQEEVEKEEYFTKVGLFFILMMIFILACYVGWVLLFGGFPA